MAILTIEGVVENGQIRLRDHVALPEQTKVYVVIPDAEAASTARTHSPRLAQPEQAADFTKQVISETPDDPALGTKLAKAEDIIGRYRNTLQVLAK